MTLKVYTLIYYVMVQANPPKKKVAATTNTKVKVTAVVNAKKKKGPDRDRPWRDAQEEE